MNTRLHAVTDANGRPISFFITAGQVSDYTGAAALLDELPKAKWLLADRGYDADWFRDALQAKGINPCIPGRKSRNKTVKYDNRDPRFRRAANAPRIAICTAESAANRRTMMPNPVTILRIVLKNQLLMLMLVESKLARRAER